jgi:hypothetical protein
LFASGAPAAVQTREKPAARRIERRRPMRIEHIAEQDCLQFRGKFLAAVGRRQHPVKGFDPSRFYGCSVCHLRSYFQRFKAYVRKAGLVDYWRARGWPDLCRPMGADDFVCD